MNTLPTIERQNATRQLDTSRIIETAENLAQQIDQRLSGSNLAALAAELAWLARDTDRRARQARRPIFAIRITSATLIGLGLLGLWYLLRHVHARWEFGTVTELFEAADAGFNLLVLLAGAVWFSITLEARIKRKKVLAAIQELREFIHVIDATQLYHTPDLSQHAAAIPGTPGLFDHRYLLFCTQMFGVISNLAALYTRGEASDSVMRAASQVEMLANSLTDKLYSKAEMVRMSSAPR